MRRFAIALALAVPFACAPPATEDAATLVAIRQAEAQVFLDAYTEKFLELSYAAEQAD